ncbi:MAG: hypothetical protein ACI841_002204 [Planctomycetota bacterium]|jgi:hypothetical protein
MTDRMNSKSVFDSPGHPLSNTALPPINAKLCRLSAFALFLPLVACLSGGGGSKTTPTNTVDLSAAEATLALGDAGYGDLSSLMITIHAMSISGDDATGHIIEEGVDDAVVIGALAYQDTAAPSPKSKSAEPCNRSS